MNNKIKEFRTNREWSAQDLADRVGCSMQQIYRLESGERQLTQKWMKRLSDALGCKPEQLISDSTVGDESLIDQEVYGVARDIVISYCQNKRENPSREEFADMLITVYEIAAREKRRTKKVNETAILLAWLERMKKSS